MTLSLRSQTPALALSAILAAATALAVTGTPIPATTTGIPLRLIVAMALLAFVVIALWLGPRPILLLWLAFAPFQSTLGNFSTGHLLHQAFFSAPPLIFVLWLLIRRRTIRSSLVDALPAFYLAYVVISAVAVGTLASATQYGLSGSSVGLTQIYSVICIGIITYYFVAFADLGDSLERGVARVLLLTGSAIAVFAVGGKVAGLNGKLAGFDFGSAVKDSAGVVEQGRIAGPFGEAGVLGTFLGMVLVVAVAVLLWEGPRALRKLSGFAVIVVPPALFLTLTRGPILATVVVCALLVAFRSRSRWPGLLGLAMVAVLLAAVWGNLAATSLYKVRFANVSNIQGRTLLDKVSLQLAGRKPVLGWGYGTFDHVKNTVPVNLGSASLPESFVLDYTSHNTFLTILVELGAVGLALLLAPWLVVAADGIRRAREPSSSRWVLIAALGIMSVWIIDAGTADTRFFPFAAAFPWLAAGLLRRQALKAPAVAPPDPPLAR